MPKRVLTETEWQTGRMRIYVRAPTLHIENVDLPPEADRVEHVTQDGAHYEFVREAPKT